MNDMVVSNIILFHGKECAKCHKEDTKSHCFFFQFQLRYKWYHVNVDEEGDIRLTGSMHLQAAKHHT